MNKFRSLLLLVATVFSVHAVAQNRYEANWQSLKQYTVPGWFQRCKVWHFYTLGRVCRTGLWR